jgi:hypothetical protein
MNTSNTNPKNDPHRDVAQASPPAGLGGVSPPLSTRAAADLRHAAVVAMLKGMKENLLHLSSPSPLDGEGAGVRDDPGQRAARMLATLKLAMQALETFPADKSTERALRSVKRAIREQEKWKAECERKP